MPEMQANYRPWPRLAEHGGYDRVRSGIGVVERVHVVGHAGPVAGLAGLPLDQRGRVLRLRGPEPAAGRSGQGAQSPRAPGDLRIGVSGVHRRDVEVMHGVIAQVVPPAQDPLRDLRVLLEPGSDGEHRDVGSRALGFGEQRLGHRYRSLAMEGERHLGPVSWPVRDLRAELLSRLVTRLAARAAARGGWRARARGGGSCGRSCLAGWLPGWLLALPRGLAVGDGTAADDPGAWPADGSPARLALVQPASPAPAGGAPAGSEEFPRSVDN